jgi:hypothetical protein
MATYVWLLTILHTILSFIAIGLGIVATAGLFRGVHSTSLTRRFFEAAALVTFTGFIFPFAGVTPAFATGIVSTAILIAWFLAHRARLAGAWRWIYVLSLVASLYLLVFVTIAQAFQKVPFLRDLAPTGSEPPFATAQAIALVTFIVIGVMVVRRFKLAAAVPA